MLLWLALSTWLPGSTPTVVISMVELFTAFSLGLGLVEEMVVEAVVAVAVVAMVAVVFEEVLEEGLEGEVVEVMEVGVWSVLVSRARVTWFATVEGVGVAEVEEEVEEEVVAGVAGSEGAASLSLAALAATYRARRAASRRRSAGARRRAPPGGPGGWWWSWWCCWSWGPGPAPAPRPGAPGRRWVGGPRPRLIWALTCPPLVSRDREASPPAPHTLVKVL